jgi:hypothetical protein
MSLLGMGGELVRAGVQFVIVGGVAASAHGSAHITQDLDICYDPDPANVERLAKVLHSWNAYLRGVEPGLPFTMDAKQFRVSPVMPLVTDHGAIDVMDRIAGVGGYAEVLAHSVDAVFDETPVRVLDLPALLKAKRATGRNKDQVQLPELEALWELRRKKGKGR